jgi:hypothetical protein
MLSMVGLALAAVVVGQPVVFRTAAGVVQCGGAIAAMGKYVWAVTAGHCVRSEVPATACFDGTCVPLAGHQYVAYGKEELAYLWLRDSAGAPPVPDLVTTPAREASAAARTPNFPAGSKATLKTARAGKDLEIEFLGCGQESKTYCEGTGGLPEPCLPTLMACAVSRGGLDQSCPAPSKATGHVCDTDSGSPVYSAAGKLIGILSGRRTVNAPDGVWIFVARPVGFSAHSAECRLFAPANAKCRRKLVDNGGITGTLSPGLDPFANAALIQRDEEFP